MGENKEPTPPPLYKEDTLTEDTPYMKKNGEEQRTSPINTPIPETCFIHSLNVIIDTTKRKTPLETSSYLIM